MATSHTPAPKAVEALPENNLPSYDECRMRVHNSDFIEKRVAEGGYGPEADSKMATQLHRFIHEYDDADPVRSAWFLHRLELLLEETKAAALAAAQAEQANPDAPPPVEQEVFGYVTRDLGSACYFYPAKYIPRSMRQTHVPVYVHPLQVLSGVKPNDGFWRSCSGCHELNEGHATGPFSNTFNCALGNGCRECGGLGAVWDNADYGAMAALSPQPPSPDVERQAVGWQFLDEPWNAWRMVDESAAKSLASKGFKVRPLYTAPPQEAGDADAKVLTIALHHAYELLNAAVGEKENCLSRRLVNNIKAFLPSAYGNSYAARSPQQAPKV
jgi:hypothetical protein